MYYRKFKVRPERPTGYSGGEAIRVKLRNGKVDKLSLTVLATQPQRGVIRQPRAAPLCLYTSFDMAYD